MLPTLGAATNYEGLQRIGEITLSGGIVQNQPSLHFDSFHTLKVSPCSWVCSLAPLGGQQRKEKE